MKKSSLKFSQPYITECTFIINKDFKNDNDTISIPSTVNTFNDYDKNEDKKKTVAGIDLEIGGREKNSPFYAKVRMEAQFVWDTSDTEEIQSYLKVNVPSLLVGYARPIITYLTANSPFPPFNVPFFDFSE